VQRPRTRVPSTTAVALSALVAVGCAPLASLRPAAAPMPGRTMEVGVGGALVSPRPHVQEPWRGAGQLWLSGAVSDRLVLSALAFFDDQAAGGGGAARLVLVDVDRVRAGVEVELGWLWAAGALPMAVRLFDQTWLYASPRLGNLGDELTPGVPFGLSVRVHDGLSVRLEGQPSWADFDAHQLRFHGALGVAWQW